MTGTSGVNGAKLGLGSSDKGNDRDNVKDNDPGTDMATTEMAKQTLILMLTSTSTSTSILMLTYGRGVSGALEKQIQISGS